jgi:hypothetical protein
MHPRFPQKRTIQRAIDSVFALRSAALRTNIAADAGAVPAGTPFFTMLANVIHRETSPSYRMIEKCRERIFI